jgi:hypothetical protein
MIFMILFGAFKTDESLGIAAGMDADVHELLFGVLGARRVDDSPVYHLVKYRNEL